MTPANTVVSPRTAQFMFCFFNRGPTVADPLSSLPSKRFPEIYGAKNEELEPKTARKMASRFISRAAKTKNPVPQSFFALKPNGHVCYAGYPMSYPSRFISNAYICTSIRRNLKETFFYSIIT